MCVNCLSKFAIDLIFSGSYIAFNFDNKIHLAGSHSFIYEANLISSAQCLEQKS